MIPGTEEIPVDEEMRLEVERLPPKDAEEAFQRYVEVLEKSSTATAIEEFPAYDVVYTRWTKGTGHGRVKLSRRVKSSRAILKTLLVFRGILKEFEEDEG